MKKIITLILVLVMMLALASCEYLPDELQATINGILGGKPAVEHTTHNFVVYDSKDATCTEDGYTKSKCDCGETAEETISALGHDHQYSHKSKPDCVRNGTAYYKCTRCDDTVKETLDALGHQFPDDSEASRFNICTRIGCGYSEFHVGNGKYADVFVFTFGDEDKATLEAKHNEILAILESAAKYDPALHGYAESGDLADAYAVAEDLYEEYTDLIYDAMGQYSIARTLYYCDFKNTELEATYTDMQEYYTELVAKYYTLSQPWYDSMFREFFFYGATDEEINAFLFDSNALADEEYTRLKNRNDEIEQEFYDIADPTVSMAVPTLYAEFVANNNAMAKRLGYDNYLEYAYENVYGRDYTHSDIEGFVSYFKECIIPLYNTYFNKWSNITANSQDDIDKFYGIVRDSFFEKRWSNEMLNDYIDDSGLVFNSNPDKQIFFSDEFNNLVADGNLFRGTYEGAHVSYIYSLELPIAYFGNGYDSTMTIAHELGHYMNEIYNKSEYDQSYDILETHSQGNEALYICYLGEIMKDNSGSAFNLIKSYYIYSTLSTIVHSFKVDMFERAIYLDSYDGYKSDEIMADGTITSDEYDLLYHSMSVELGISEEVCEDEDSHINDYWKYGMTISSPCYYISYAISALNALQLHAMACEDYEAAVDSYLKLFTYTDVNPDMSDSEILNYAGVLHFTVEDAYIKIHEFLK